jgi:hypothetical protein
MLGMAKQAVIVVLFTAGVMLTVFAMGASRELLMRVLATGLPTAIVAISLASLLKKYFNPTR